MKQHRIFAILLVILLWAALAEVDPKRASAQARSEPELISQSNFGERANGWSEQPGLSADARFVTYVSQANNLTPGDANRAADIFVFDRGSAATRLVSRSSAGEPANGWSFHPEISADGRFVAFASVAQNLAPGDSNGLADVFLHDLVTGDTSLVSGGKSGVPGNGWSDRPSLSADGRYLVFVSNASNLVHGDTNRTTDVFLHDRLTGQTRRISVGPDGTQGDGQSAWTAVISSDSQVIVFTSNATNFVPGSGLGGTNLFVHHRVTGATQWLPASGFKIELDAEAWPSLNAMGDLVAYRGSIRNTAGAPQETVIVQDTQTGEAVKIISGADGEKLIPTLSGDGRWLWVAVHKEDTQSTSLLRHDLQTGAVERFIGNSEDPAFKLQPWPVAVAADGQAAVFGAVQTSGPAAAAVYLQNQLPQGRSQHIVAGQVLDGAGLPLQNTVVGAEGGLRTRSGPDGRFYLAGLASGPLQLTFEKEGFRFSPAVLTIELEGDVTGLQVIGALDDVLDQARLDIGMPYSFHRGCDSDLTACGGPYHGFHAGYCTDLVLDAYRGGPGFNIQFALERDALIHPEHFYRWRNARNSHDMWRYFHYTEQMLANDAPYLPGDILFFDWDEDAVIDHVSILSELDASGKPARMVDATGEIAYNPSGLAAELAWVYFHEQTIRGHARWRGSFGPSWNDAPADLEMLQVAVDGIGVSIRLIAENGKKLPGNQYLGSSVGAHSVIEGGHFFHQPLGESIALPSPRALGQTFLLEITPSETTPFYLHIQSKHGAVVTRYQGSWQAGLDFGEPMLKGLVLQGEGDDLRFTIIDLN